MVQHESSYHHALKKKRLGRGQHAPTHTAGFNLVSKGLSEYKGHRCCSIDAHGRDILEVVRRFCNQIFNLNPKIFRVTAVDLLLCSDTDPCTSRGSQKRCCLYSTTTTMTRFSGFKSEKMLSAQCYHNHDKVQRL